MPAVVVPRSSVPVLVMMVGKALTVPLTLTCCSGAPELVLVMSPSMPPTAVAAMRASMVEVLESDYIEMARLKGLPERTVLVRHALPNALGPVFQVIALNLAYLAGGIVVVEFVFDYTGIGSGLHRVGIPVPRYPLCEEVTLGADYQIARSNSLEFRLVCQAQMALFDHSALFSFVTIAFPWDASLLINLYYLGNAHKAILAESNVQRTEQTQAISMALAREIRASGAAAIWTGGPYDMQQQLVLPELEREGWEQRQCDASVVPLRR